MCPDFVTSLSDTSAGLSQVGGKGASLARMAAAGLPVPDGFHITTAAYREFVTENGLQPHIVGVLQSADPLRPTTLETASKAIRDRFARAHVPPQVTGAIAQAYARLPGEAPVVAVRSSATAEDLPDLSFAGQQETYLNVCGIEAVLDAVERCWASLWTARAIGYRMQHGIDQGVVSLAVVVQLLVPAEVSGVMFTAHPVTGQREQAVISAAWGLGETVVGGTVTPDTLTVDKTSGQVVVRETADKQVMAVRVQGGTEEQPVPDALRRAPVLADRQAIELAQLGVQIEQLYGQPMDIEWAWADGRFAIVQARPITALPASEAAAAQVPNQWDVPDPKAICFRTSIVELLPDPLTPLFSTLGRKEINAGTGELFAEILGPGVMPDEILITVNDYAYYQMRFTLKLVWRFTIGILRFWPKLRHSEARWKDEAVPRYTAVIERWASRPLREWAAAELLTAARELVTEAVRLYNVLQSGAVGMAMGAEMLFTTVYEKLIQRGDDPPASTLLLGSDSMPIRAEKSLYDLASWCSAHAELAGYVVQTATAELIAQLEKEQPPPGVATGEWEEWQRRFRAHLAQYGHAIYDLDFAKAVPADDPTPLLGTLKMYLRGQGTDPYARQQQLAARREAGTQAISARLRGLRRKLFHKLLGWAQKYVPIREDSLADLGLGYPLLRRMLHELGRRLVQAGTIEEIDDAYWLYEAEAREVALALDQGTAKSSMDEKIRQRKAVWRAEKQVTPPPALPLRAGLTGLMEKVGPARSGEKTGSEIAGVGASPGRITAPACVLHGPEEFEQMVPGNVLVAAITTPAWTPLFAMASAIVTDVGGPLSHGSIVAREYGIPAVLGTGVATRRIRSGQVVTVDGSVGLITLDEG